MWLDGGFLCKIEFLLRKLVSRSLHTALIESVVGNLLMKFSRKLANGTFIAAITNTLMEPLRLYDGVENGRRIKNSLMFHVHHALINRAMQFARSTQQSIW